jgi:hypothetical protein
MIATSHRLIKHAVWRCCLLLFGQGQRGPVHVLLALAGDRCAQHSKKKMKMQAKNVDWEQPQPNTAFIANYFSFLLHSLRLIATVGNTQSCFPTCLSAIIHMSHVPHPLSYHTHTCKIHAD